MIAMVTYTILVLLVIQNIQNSQLFIVNYQVLAGFVLMKMTLIDINTT